MTRKPQPFSIVLPCSCMSVEHTIRLESFVDEHDKQTVYVLFMLDAPGLWQRLKLCAQFLAGWRPCVFEAVVEGKEIDGLMMYLDQERGP